MDPALLPNVERSALELIHASLRMGAMLALLPAMGGQMIPVRIRIGLAGAIGYLVMTGASPPQPPADLLGLPGLAAIAGELLIGAVAGLALNAGFAAAMIAGDWLSQSMGLGFATMVDPGAPPSPVLSGMLALLMWLVLLQSGGHLLLIETVVESYRVMPSAGALFEPERLRAIFGWGSFAIASGLIAALPLGVAMLLVNISIAVAARSSPQLNLFSIGFPLMLLVGLVGMPIAMPRLADSVEATLSGAQDRLQQVLLG